METNLQKKKRSKKLEKTKFIALFLIRKTIKNKGTNNSWEMFKNNTFSEYDAKIFTISKMSNVKPNIPLVE